MLRNTFAADKVVSVESNWHDGPTVDGMLAEEPRHAAVIKEVLEGEQTQCALATINCNSYVGPFFGTDWMGNEKLIWSDFYVTEVDGEVKAYCIDCIEEVVTV